MFIPWRIGKYIESMDGLDKTDLLKQERARLLARIQEIDQILAQNDSPLKIQINKFSPIQDKIKLYKSLFRGREDAFAKRFESAKSGKSGYQPVCENEWIRGVCDKPRIKCSFCSHRKFVPFNEVIIEKHLRGEELSGNYTKPFVSGIYPLLNDDTCYFLAVDFDESTWKEDARAFIAICESENVPAYLERSRSGNGGHIWIFFETRIKAKTARELGSFLLTKTLDSRPEIKLTSFDRFFPNQDFMPKGGLGNLVALPLQKKAREMNHSVFIDPSTGNPFEDQWLFLSNIQKISKENAEEKVLLAEKHHEVLPAYENETEEEMPWHKRTNSYPTITTPLPTKIEVVLANQIFIDFTGIPSILRNRIFRLASFQNPEFYQAQAMRLPVWGKPRILYCYDIVQKYIGLPIGCLDELLPLLEHYHISPAIKDNRNKGTPIHLKFLGNLYPEQILAAEALLKNDCGVLSATTAFGKTIVALWIIAKRNVNTLILVHRTQLMEQWVEKISIFLNIPRKEIGQLSGTKKKRFGRIDVALIPSVSRQGCVEEWIDDYGQIIVDECHHISAFSFEQAVRKSKAKYKIGLSATLTRKDGQHPIVLMNLGPVRYTVSAKNQFKEGSLTHKVVFRETDFQTSSFYSKAPIQDIFRELWNNEKRNEIILEDIVQAHQNNRQILVLSERTEHLAYLFEKLKDRIPALFVMKGGMGKKQLKQIKDDIETRKKNESIAILATGRYIGEGFDLPELDTLFLPFPISWRGTLAQYVGRLHRESDNKTEVQVYDYVDSNVPVLKRMSEKRKKGYESLGYDY